MVCATMAWCGSKLTEQNSAFRRSKARFQGETRSAVQVDTDDAGYLVGKVTSYDGEHFDASCDDTIAKAVVRWTHKADDVSDMKRALERYGAILPSKKRALEVRETESPIVIDD